MNNGAEFSKDRNYRYALWRIWNEGRPLVMFIGLNPSTANEFKPDPTIRNVMKIADANGYGGFYMMNLFAFVASKPAILEGADDPMGDNAHWLEKIAIQCDAICFAWGAFGDAKKRRRIRARAEMVKIAFPGAYCLTKTKSGEPGHPLFLPANSKMQLFKP